jgi:hypothetical protein
LLDANLWRRILGVDRATVIESVEGDEETDALVVRVRPRRATKRRCGRCGVRSPGLRPGRRATSLALSRPRTEFGASVRHERRRRGHVGDNFRCGAVREMEVRRDKPAWRRE